MAYTAALSLPVNLNSFSAYRCLDGFRGSRMVSVKASSDLSVEPGGAALVSERRKQASINGAQTRRKLEPVPEALDLFYDDGYGSTSVIDYLDIAKDLVKKDGGPPRWFCPVECGAPIKGAPLLLFLPGVDGVGLGLILHHKSLGKVFEVRCLHIPVYDQTPFEGLVKFVEDTVRCEHVLSPNMPIYLVGDSFGGCLALAVAARNPTIDLILVLANPATSFGNSQLQPVLPLLELLPRELHVAVPYLLSFIMGDPVKLAMANIESGLPPLQTLDELSKNLTSMLPCLSHLADIIPKETLAWKLRLLKSASAYANSRLHAVKAEVLVLVSGEDKMLPSKDEAERLWRTLSNCTVRYFKANGHSLLLEDGIHFLTIIKGAQMYRRSKRFDYIADYLPPSLTDYKVEFEKENGFFRLATSPVMLSTLEDGKIVQGLAGVPNEGPVLLVGYHMLLGFELASLVDAFMREKHTVIRGMAHPTLFSPTVSEDVLQEVSRFDLMRVFGALPVSPGNFYKLLQAKSFVLLYPGGAREALHLKGEEYKVIWPHQPEFVRMAARFGATIVPFGVVGEDDIAELFLDYNDQINIPFLRDWIKDLNDKVVHLRTEADGEVANQKFYLPGILPKIPGRFYYLFGKPIKTAGEMVLKDKETINTVYLQIKSEVEKSLTYLLQKREEDPYRSILQRSIYQATNGFTNEVPTFDP
ncbi:phytyl ester synthase 1, chloroplastic-like [Aristolochia californica]|uniref:phytyl ester synthase 1, chloroplastic-like n=1 Tax=Aristolochia californica TaxID=171875 RepID=UPI0035D5BA20